MKTLRKRKNGWYEAKIRINTWDKITYKSLGTQDKTVAQKRMNELYRQMELESEGLTTSQKMRDAAEGSLLDLIKRYIRTLEAGYQYINQTESRLKRLCADCGWRRIKDVDAESFQNWGTSHSDYSPKTKNHYRSSLNAFFTWLVDNGLAMINPIEKTKPVPVRGRRAFIYRALSADEMKALLELPRRSEIYHFAAMTGLRHAEVGKVQWGDLHLDSNPPFIHVRADTTKNGHEATIKLHADLVALLCSIRPRAAKAAAYVFPFMPDNKTVRRDFINAGIETNNDRKEKASFHSLRKTFCTMLHMAGVPQRETQELMRHSDAKLTNDVYADRSLFSLGSAIDSLPSLSKTTAPPPEPPKSDLMGHNLAQTDLNGENGASAESANSLEKTKGMPISEAFLIVKEWCTRMESNHHAVAGTRT